MASISTTRSVFIRLCKCSLSLRSSRKASRSRVFFAFASNYSDWRNAAEGTRDWRAHGVYNSTMAAGRVAEDHQDKDMGERAKETMREGVEEAKERAKEGANRAAETAKEGAEKTEQVAESATEKAAETTKSVGEKAKQTVEGAWGAAKDTTQKIKETVVGKEDDDREMRRRADQKKSF